MFLAGRLPDRSEYLDRWDRTMEWLTFALLAFMPLVFGAVEAWSEEIVLVLTAVLCLCFCVRMTVAAHPPLVRTWAYLPVVVFLAVVVVQLLPLPVGLVSLVSPHTVAQKTELRADLPDAAAPGSALAISFYGQATKHDLRLALATAAFFFIVLNVFRRPDQIRRLLLVIATIGAGVALLALAQDLVGNNKIYWCVPVRNDIALSGPFVNHSHYAQFMNLSIGAALALALLEVHRAFAGSRVTPAAVAEYLGSSESGLLWGLCVMIVFAVATIFLSLSRGGVVSTMIAGAFTLLAMRRRTSLRGSVWATALLSLGALFCVLYLGFDAVCDRLGTLRELHQAQGGRWQIVKDVAAAWMKFPVVGTGLGTHEVVYPMFDHSAIAARATHAENEYAQLAEEMGLAGLVPLLAFGALVWYDYARALRAASAFIHPVACGLGFGLLAILVHSLSDFGQHVPANVFLTVAFCALLLRLPHLEEGRVDRMVRAHARSRWYGVGAWAVLFLAGGWTLLGADRARVGETHWRRAVAEERDLMARQWQGSDEEYQYLLRHLQAAWAHEPGNVVYRHWLNVNRWRAISRRVDPNTREAVLSVEALEFAGRIADDLSLTRRLCPTFGPTWCVLGQLERLVLGQAERGAQHIRRGVALAPCDATAQFVAATLEAEEGHTDAAIAHLLRSVQLDNQFYREAAVLLVEQFHQPDLALRTAAGDTHRLQVLVDVLETSGAGTAALRQVRGQVVTLLEQKCREPGAPAWAFAWLAGRYEKEGRLAEAIACYREALASDYSKSNWHFGLARLLAEAGAADEAVQEAKVCLRLHPEHADSLRLIERISTDLRWQRPGGR